VDLGQLLIGADIVGAIGPIDETEVRSIELDSRKVTPRALYCCLVGQNSDGHDYAEEAVGRGATALLVDHYLPLSVPQVLVERHKAREVVASISCELFGHPADSLTTVGVTGTNGKTTVTNLISSILNANSVPTAVIGTLTGARTTPEAPELQKQLADAISSGSSAVAMEVSSHSLIQHRVDGFRFDCAVFTNLSHDHLDFHGTMEAYFEAKAKLFTAEHAKLGVIDVGTSWGERLLREATVPVIAFSEADATDVLTTPEGTSFRWQGNEIRLSLVGSYHVANAVAAASAAKALGISDSAIVAGLASAATVPGRFEVVVSGDPATIVVDYAHTPDGLAAALASARMLAGAGRVICVFGCGGDRDAKKRPEMGTVATTQADIAIVTNDNPRSEDPLEIIDQIMSGSAGDCEIMVVPDRREAIEAAVSAARTGDVVLIAGKGHESTIEAKGAFEPFDDKVEALAAVVKIGAIEDGPR
jgi:UDP-N-acetylmuramoyl-L-alanyl-D-glutamate--2,6-diaminopimelate ligase